MIKEVVYEYWDSDLPEVKPRHTKLDSGEFINDIVGIRRCGKTYLMYDKIKKIAEKTGKKSTIYINFENRKLFPLKQEYFNELVEFIHSEKLMEKGKIHLFLDEVQRIGGWERFVRSIYDEFKGKIGIYVSGSNASLLTKDYGTLLTGRHITTTLMPLDFKEFLEFKGYNPGEPLTEKKRATIKKLLEEYLKSGGFPEVVLSEQKERIIGQLFNDILSRDVLTRTVRKENILEEFTYYLAANITSLLSFNKMANYFKSRGIKISVQTLENYFWLIKNSFLFHDNLIFSHKIKDQLKNPRKIYCIDNGIANLIGFKSSENYGRLYENTAFIKLKKESADKPLVKLYYWKNQLHEEVDFVIREGMEVKNLVQVCYNIDKPETKKREVRALLKASRELKCENLLIITEDKEGEEKADGKTIRYTPLWKWLLE